MKTLVDIDDDYLPEEYGLGSSLKQALEEMKKMRKEQHRASMVTFRQNRKERQKRIQAELERLENEMKLAVERVRIAASNHNNSEHCNSTSTADALQELIVERECLQTENRSIRAEVQRHEKFYKMVVKASQEAAPEESMPVLPQPGWRVHFDRGEPSFLFHPLTREEYDEGLLRFDANTASGLLSLSMIGTFFGWEIQRAQLVYSSLNSKSVAARARLTKRVQCSLDVLFMASYREVKDISPTIVTPIGCSIHQRHNVSTQVLQEFDHSCPCTQHPRA